MSSETIRRLIVSDACVFINLLKLRRLDLLLSIEGFIPVTTKLVIEEITDSVQAHSVDETMKAGRIEVVDPNSEEAIKFYIKLRDDGLGKGEASCLAYCTITSYTVLACDEKARCFLRAVEKLGLEDRIVTTRDLVNLAVHEGRLSLNEANTLLADLRTRFRFSSADLQTGEPLPLAFT